jgi:hypothetical protein
VLHDRASARSLGILRAAVFTIWLGDLLREPITDLARLPVDLFDPLGVLKLVPAEVWPVVFSVPFLVTFKWAMVALALPLALGIGPYRLLAVAAALAFTLWQGLSRGMLGVVHREMAILYVTWVLALAPAADAFRLGPLRPPRAAAWYRAPLMAATLAYLLTYAAVGVRRLTAAGPEIFTDGTILRYLVMRSGEPGWWRDGAGLAVLSQPWLAWLVQLAFPVVTLFEVLAPLTLIDRRFRLAWIVVIVPFHLLSWGMMQIFFLQNILLLPFLLHEWAGERAEGSTAEMGEARPAERTEPVQAETAGAGG